MRPLALILGVLLTAGGAAPARAGESPKERPDTLARPTTGKVTGWVLDAGTRKPIAGARVAVTLDGEFPDSGRATATTTADGRYLTRAPLGRSTTRFDWGRLLTMSPISLLVSPRSVTKQTRILDVLQVNVRAEAPGYRPFVGRVRAGVLDPGDFEIALEDVWLAPDGSKLASFTPERLRLEAVDTLRVEPPIVAGGEKVKVTLTALLPVSRGFKYRAYAASSATRLIEGQPELKREKDEGPPEAFELTRVVFSREFTLPKRSTDRWAEISFHLMRDGRTELRRRETRALLQIVDSPAERAAAERVEAGYRAAREGRDDEALRGYDAARKLKPDYPLAQQLFGDLALALNRPRDAADAFRVLCEIDPRDYEYRARHAAALTGAGRPGEALAQLADAEKVLGKKVPARVHLQRARAHAHLGKFAECDEALAKAGESLRIAAETLDDINLRRLSAAVAAKPDDPNLRLSYARVLEGARRLEEAVAQARRAVELEPGEPWAYLDLGDLLLAAGRTEEGLAHLRHAQTLAPDNLEVLTALGDAHRAAGRWAEALPLYRRVVEAQRLNISARQRYALMLYATGAPAEARREFVEVITQARDKGELRDDGIPFFGPGLLGSGLYFGPKRRLVAGFSLPEAAAAAALVDALEALERSPGNALLLQNVGRALLDMDEPRAALKALEDSRRADPALAETPFLLGAAHRRLGDGSAAIRELRAALAANPLHPRAHLELAQLHTEQGDLELAEAALLAHAANYPYDAPPRPAAR